MPSESTRAYLYRILTVALPVLVFYGVLAEQSVALWIALGGSVLGTGLASANTSTDAP